GRIGAGDRGGVALRPGPARHDARRPGRPHRPDRRPRGPGVADRQRRPFPAGRTRPGHPTAGGPMLPTLALTLLLPAADAPVPADFVIRGATIYDGTGGPGRMGDVAIRGDRIAAVGTFAAAGNPKVIDSAGLAVAPGFIDLHTHCDS